jgi:hypothetical protein
MPALLERDRNQLTCDASTDNGFGRATIILKVVADPERAQILSALTPSQWREQ